MLRRAALSLFLLAAALPAAGQPCEYWVAPAPAGSDGNPGTLAQPWATLDHASASVADDTCTVYFQDGVYTGTHSLYERFSTPTTFRAQNRYRAVLQYAGTVVKLFGAKNMIFEGFELRHTGPGSGALVMQVQQASGLWAENITIRDNVFHDSYNNDLLKINNGARFVTVEDNVFYNQAGSDEHIDINSVTDVLVQDNVFFNDFAGSGRVNANDTSSFIVMKDSNAAADGQIGDERITVRRNVFLNWEGSSGANFALVGEDGMPYFEGQSILVENNLMIGNSNNDMRAAFGVKGGRDITFRANTVVGDLPSLAYALRVNREGANPVNENVVFRNNVWSDPTGTMGAEAGGGTNEFSDGLPSEASGLVLDNNLYWNGPAAIPPGDLLSPLTDDAHRVVADPQLNTNQSAIVLPRWNGASFASGNATIREEFERLVGLYGSISGGSPAAGQADPAFVPADDILGRPRGGSPDLGAYESNASGMGISPASGHSSGGTGVAITGFGFMAGAAVTLGGANATGVSVSSGAFATATTPSLPPGTLNDVTLTNPDATFSTLTKGWFSDFLDVPQPDPFHKYVERIFRNGITAGCGGGSYCRDASVTRAEMAVFLLKAFLGSGYTPPAGAGIFQDVPPGAFAADWIEDLANRGITAGCGNDNYCPNDPVTRAQMAVFLLKTLLGSAYTPPAGAGIFQDVPPGAFAIDWIEDLSSRGITAGCQAVPPRYCPDDPNTRGQMAVFLTKTFGLP